MSQVLVNGLQVEVEEVIEETESVTLTIDEQLDEIERLLITSLHTKVTNGESLSSLELQLVTRWLKSRDSVGRTKKPKDPEPTVYSGPPLPFLLEKPSLEDMLAKRDDE